MTSTTIDCTGEEVGTLFLPSITAGSRKTPNKATNLHNSHLCHTPLQLPFLPVATKAEKYAQLTAFDQSGLKRKKAHVRNALKTTDCLEKVAKQLNQRLSRMEQSDSKISFERLSVYRDAFEEIIKLSNVFSPLLQPIKDVYNQHLLYVLSQHQPSKSLPSNLLLLPPPSSTNDNNTLQDQEASDELLKLKKQLHQLEVEARVLIHENERLREDLIKEVEFHRREMEKLQDSTDDLLPVYETSSSDYASKVEEIQLQIAEERMAIAGFASKRKGRIPLSVCHHLEQCIREVEIEIQKAQRRSNNLEQDIKKAESQLQSTFKAHGYQLESNDVDLMSVLGLS